MKKAAEFLKNVREKDNVVVIFNNDADGVSSCALVCRLLEKTCNNKPLKIGQPMPPEDMLIKKIQTTIPDKIIFLDMPMDHEKTLIKKIGSLCEVLVVDHHQVKENLNSSRIVHCNPRMKKNGIYQSTSYVAYKITSLIEDMSDSLWIAAVGMIGDYNLDDSQDLVESVRKKYGIKEKKLYDSYLGRIADMIGAARATGDLTMEDAVDVFLETGDYTKIGETKKGEKLVKSWGKIEDEMERLKIDVGKNVEKHGNVLFYEFKSEYNLRSSLSTSVSEREKSKIFVIYSAQGTNVGVSARNQSREFNVGKLLEEAAHGLRASAGGHEAAAGAKVSRRDWEKFKERLIKMANE